MPLNLAIVTNRVGVGPLFVPMAAFKSSDELNGRLEPWIPVYQRDQRMDSAINSGTRSSSAADDKGAKEEPLCQCDNLCLYLYIVSVWVLCFCMGHCKVVSANCYSQAETLGSSL